MEVEPLINYLLSSWNFAGVLLVKTQIALPYYEKYLLYKDWRVRPLSPPTDLREMPPTDNKLCSTGPSE